MTQPSLLLLNPLGREDWGGVEADMLKAAVGLAGRGWTVSAAGRSGSLFLARMGGAGLSVLPLGLRRDFGPVDAIRLRRHLRRRGIRVVVTKLSRGIRLAGLARVLGSGAALVQHQGLFEIREGFRHRFAYRWVERVVTPARSVRDRIVASGMFPADRVDWVPNGIDAAAYRPDREAGARARRRHGLPDGFLVVNTSRLHAQKAHDLMLDAFALLPPDVHLALAGRGRLEAHLRQRACEPALAGRLHLLGHVHDVPDLLRAADAFVSTSHYEGMPNSVLEAMAAGLAVVATDVGDVGRMLDGGRAGELVGPGDAAAVAARIRVLAEDPERRRRLGDAARGRAREEYGIGRMLDGMEECLLRAVHGPAATRAAPAGS